MLFWALSPTYHPSPKLTVIFLWWTLSPCPPRQPSSGNLTHSKTSLCGPLLLAFLEGTYHIARGEVWVPDSSTSASWVLGLFSVLLSQLPVSPNSHPPLPAISKSNYFPATPVALSIHALLFYCSAFESYIHQPTVSCEQAGSRSSFLSGLLRALLLGC